MWQALIGPIAGLLDKLIPDPAARAAAKLELVKEENAVALQTMQASMSAILAEAQSSDKWTSRARPTFMYIFYFVIISLVMIAPIIGVFYPNQMSFFFSNVAKGFDAIPEPMWWTFSAGYLGYAGARSMEKIKGVSR